MAERNISFGGRRIPLPRSRIVRIVLGVALIVGGIVGFLPILGFWMIPLGLIVLSVDIPIVRTWRRKAEVWLARHVQPRWERLKAWWRGRKAG